MSFPFTEVFLALLLAYMVYSVWARMDARYPIAAALILLVVTAVVDALGETGTANTLAEYVFFLLGAGVLLLLIDHVRERRTAQQAEATSSTAVPGGGATEPVEKREGTTQPTAQPGPSGPAVDAEAHEEKAGTAGSEANAPSHQPRVEEERRACGDNLSDEEPRSEESDDASAEGADTGN